MGLRKSHFSFGDCGACADGGGGGGPNPCGFACLHPDRPTSWSDLTTRVDDPVEAGWYETGFPYAYALDGRIWPIQAMPAGYRIARPAPLYWGQATSQTVSMTAHTRLLPIQGPGDPNAAGAGQAVFSLAGSATLQTLFGSIGGSPIPNGPSYSWGMLGLSGAPSGPSGGPTACDTSMTFTWTFTLGDIVDFGGSPCGVNRYVTRTFTASDGVTASDTSVMNFQSSQFQALCEAAVQIDCVRGLPPPEPNYWPDPVHVSAVSYSAS